MEFSAVFPIRERCLYLDHASLAPLPEPVVVAATTALHQHQQESFWDLRELNQVDQKVRFLVAHTVGCEPSDVSLFPDSATALTALLVGLDLPPGTRFLLASEEPEETHPLASLLQRLGWSPTVLAPARWEHLHRLLETNTPEGAVVYLPWVDAAGWVGDLETVAKKLTARGCIVVLDATQAVPCRPESFPELEVAALLVPSHTWLLGPRGAAALITTPELRNRWRPLFSPSRKPSTEHLRDAACFESQGVSPLVLAGWAASLELLVATGLGVVRSRIFAHQRTLTSQLLELGWNVASPGASHPVAGIVLAQHPFFPAEEVQRRLHARHVRVGTLGSWLRFSPHFYTTLAELDALQKILSSL